MDSRDRDTIKAVEWEASGFARFERPGAGNDADAYADVLLYEEGKPKTCESST